MRRASLLLASVLLTACNSNGNGGGNSSSSSGGSSSSSGGSSSSSGTSASSSSSSSGRPDSGVPPVDGGIADPCSLPGSVLFLTSGTITMPGGSPTWPSLSFLHLPAGFCAHYYGTVGDARQLRFAPGGELFVSSPSALSTGGNAGAGLNAIVVLPDDNLDGVADATITFLQFGSGAMNQGLLFAPGFFYYQDGTPPGTKIMRMPYDVGDRMPSGMSEQVADVTVYTSGLHWVKTLDMADDGSIYVGNGGDQGEACDPTHPFHGGVLQIDAAPGGANPGGKQIAKGLRNPTAIRCAKGHDNCFALELAMDYTADSGGREKLIPIHEGDDWGFPCCATKNLAYNTAPAGTNCSGVNAETNSFYIGDTPFGVDFEPGVWPGQWAGRAYVATHGAAGTWTGARVVAIPMDASTGLPLPSTNINGDSDVGMVDFATGWDDLTNTHGRPAAVAFSPDGRLFLANDNDGTIIWIAPITM
jgi:glucose/arabinose dehydrogenase